MGKRIWRAIEVTVRDVPTGRVERYIVETAAGWKFAEKKAALYAMNDGFTAAMVVQSDWLSSPFFRGR